MVWWLTSIALILTLAYLRSPARIWVPALAIWILFSSFSGTLSAPAALLDLARFMFPYGVLPRRWRSTLFHHNAGPETRTVCSTLIAQAFQNVSYPILPVLQENDFGYKELSHRNSRLFSPLDFDISPWFDIMKFPLQSFDDEASYSKMPWKEGTED